MVAEMNGPANGAAISVSFSV